MTPKIIYILLGASLMLGCSSSDATNVGANNRVDAAPAMASPMATPATLNTPPGDRSNQKPVPAPTTQIGSGGNDLSLFAQLRASISSDPELLKSVVINVKEGAVILSGTVSSTGQKQKAEQMIKSVKGVKSLKNEIRVAS